MMASPSSSTSYGDLLANIFTQGFTGATFENGDANVLSWNEGNGAADTTARGFVPLGAAGEAPATGQGFIAYVFADEDPDAGGEQVGFPKFVQVDRPQLSGTVNFPLTLTKQGGTYVADQDGFNLVGNPYGATINWDVSGWTKTNIDNTIYVWDSAANGGTGDYLTWNGTAGTLVDGRIAPWQAFWVKANNNGTPALEATDAVRGAGGVFYGAPGETTQAVPQIGFTLKEKSTSLSQASTLDIYSEKRERFSQPNSAAGSGVGLLQSQAIVMFSPQASAGLDPLDAYKLTSLNARYLSLFTTASDAALEINALSQADSLISTIEVDMDFDGSALGGEYTLSWEPKDLPQGWSARLTDLHTDREIDLRQAGDYTFSVVQAARVGSGVQPPHNHKDPPKNHKEPSHNKKISSEGVALPTKPPAGGAIPTVVKGKLGNNRFVLRFAPRAEDNRELPSKISVSSAYPNPFGETCNVDLAMPEKAHVRVDVYDILGRKITMVVDKEMAAGFETITMDASQMGVASGVYLCRINIGDDFTDTMKMTFIK